jgi:hypothetical protein
MMRALAIFPEPSTQIGPPSPLGSLTCPFIHATFAHSDSFQADRASRRARKLVLHPYGTLTSTRGDVGSVRTSER